jgi:cytochrome c oxidase subunit I+III
LLAIWAVLHVGVGILMLLYCVARRLTGNLTAKYDADLANTTLYWHFAILTTVITVAVIAGFPLLA